MVSYPKDWEEVKLGQLCRIKTGTKNNEDKVKGGKYPFFVRSSVVERIDTFSYDTESILVPGEGNIGSIFHYVNGKFDVHQRVYAITNFSNRVYAKYIYWYMKRNFGDYALTQTSKATVDSLRLPSFIEFLIYLPSRKEQKAIADALTAFDTHISNLSKLIEKKKMIRDGAVEDLVSGKRRLAGFSGEWKVCVLNSVVEILNGDRGFNYPSSNDMKAYGVPFINAGNIKDGYVSFDDMEYIAKEKYNALGGGKIKKHDILFCLRGSIGKFAHVNFNCGAPASSLCIIRGLSAIKSKFLFYSLLSNASIESVKQLNSGSSQPNISAKELKTIDIKIPSSLLEQQAIADILTAMDKEIADLEEEKEKYMELKAGAMDDLLTGKIRLV